MLVFVYEVFGVIGSCQEVAAKCGIDALTRGPRAGNQLDVGEFGVSTAVLGISASRNLVLDAAGLEGYRERPA